MLMIILIIDILILGSTVKVLADVDKAATAARELKILSEVSYIW